jgi:hypothetical protein
MAAVPDRARQAFRNRHVGFVVAPVLAGLDKFFDLLVALRDFGLSLGALALARLAEALGTGPVLRPAAARRRP